MPLHSLWLLGSALRYAASRNRQQPLISTTPLVLQNGQYEPQDPKITYMKRIRGLGITEVVLGIISTVLAIVAMSITGHEVEVYNKMMEAAGISYEVSSTSFGYIGQGIWCGALVILTGILGIRVVNKPSDCMYSVNLAMSIITTIVTFAVSIMSGGASAVYSYSLGLRVIHLIIAVMSFAAFIIAIIHSSYSCSGACYTKPPVMQTVPVVQNQYIQGPNGQIMVAGHQPTHFYSQVTTTVPCQQVIHTIPSNQIQVQYPQPTDGIVNSAMVREAPPAYC